MKNHTRTLVVTALLASLVCVATMLIKIPSPLQGYLHAGDGVVLLAGWILSPVHGLIAAALGSVLADLFAGYALYAPVTCLVKGLMALIACLGYRLLRKKWKELPSRILCGVVAELVMVLGYYVFEGFLYGFIPAAVNIPLNAVQGAVGLILGLLLVRVFEKSRIRFY